MKILSFDIEEWFHILDNQSTRGEAEWSNYECRVHNNVDRILDILTVNNQTATFFCLGWIAEKYPEIVKKINDLGFEIGSHTDMHQLIYEQSPEQFGKDLSTSIDRLQNITGKKVRAFRAPGFSIREENKWAMDILAENGIEMDCSIFPANRAHGGYRSFLSAGPSIIESRGIKIKEFPVNVYSLFGRRIVFSGGGYFRLLPYSVIRHMMNRSDYVMTYFHPRDFDPDQPVIKDVSLLRMFKSYYGLDLSFIKLKKLLADFEFVDLGTADELVDWSNARVVSL